MRYTADDACAWLAQRHADKKQSKQAGLGTDLLANRTLRGGLLGAGLGGWTYRTFLDKDNEDVIDRDRKGLACILLGAALGSVAGGTIDYYAYGPRRKPFTTTKVDFS